MSIEKKNIDLEIPNKEPYVKPKKKMSEKQLEILARGRKKRKENLETYRTTRERTKEVKKQVRKVNKMVNKTFPDGVPEEISKTLPQQLITPLEPVKSREVKAPSSDAKRKVIRRGKPLQKIRLEVYADSNGDSDSDSSTERKETEKA